MTVSLSVEGRPRALAQALDLSAYRILQEALTNVIKHAGGADATVTLSYRAQELEITVIDTGDGALAARSPESSEGHGVIGMRERAALFGGTLTAEPRLDRGFKVTAMLHYGEPGS